MYQLEPEYEFVVPVELDTPFELEELVESVGPLELSVEPEVIDSPLELWEVNVWLDSPQTVLLVIVALESDSPDEELVEVVTVIVVPVLPSVPVVTVGWVTEVVNEPLDVTLVSLEKVLVEEILVFEEPLDDEDENQLFEEMVEPESELPGTLFELLSRLALELVVSEPLE